MIYNESPMEALWNIFKEIRTQVAIYKNTMDEDLNSIPDSYILIRTASDNSKNFGDSECLIRKCDCDIIIISKGKFRSTLNIQDENIKKVESILKINKIDYSKTDLGYDSNTKNTHTVISLVISYYA